MNFGVWLALVTLFLAGGLTPGPAVMLVTTSSMRYGFWPSMMPALGICAANLLWVALAAFGASALAHTWPAAFSVLQVLGLVYIVWLAWQMSSAGPLDFTRREPPPRARSFRRGVALQLANPNALLYFGGLLPAYIDRARSLATQCGLIMFTITTTELFGLMLHAVAADWLARRFARPAFALWFYRAAALAMVSSAIFAVGSKWIASGS